LSASNIAVPAANAINEYYGTPFRKSTVEAKRRQGPRWWLSSTNRPGTPAHIIAESLQSAPGAFGAVLKNGLKQKPEDPEVSRPQAKMPSKVARYLLL